MKMNEIVSEQKEFINEYFDTSKCKKISYYDSGIDVDGSIQIKEHVELKELPFKFEYVNGSFNLSNCGLTSLKNFPRYGIGTVDVSNNPDLISLDTSTQHGFVSFFAMNCGMKNLEGLQLTGSLFELNLSDCKNLESLHGIDKSLNISRLVLKNCDQFKEDISSYRISEAYVDFEKNPKPFLFSLLKGFIVLDDIENEKFLQIAKKYKNKEMTEIFDLIRELRDNRFI